MEHTLAHLLTTNEIPSASQALTIQGLIAEEESKSSRLLQQRKERIQNIESYRIVVSAVRRIPPDVVETIFLCAIASYTWPNSPTVAEILPMTQVCAMWHYVAMNSGRLWVSSTFRLHPNGADQFENYLEWIRRRAHYMPLSLSVLFDDPINHLHHCPGFIYIPSHLAQFTWLHVRGPTSVINAILRNQPSLQCLTTLSIDVKTCPEHDFGFNLFEIESLSLPKLVTFKCEAPSDFEFHKYPIPWSQITSLDMGPDGATKSNALSLLQLIPNLVDCRIFMDEESNGSTWQRRTTRYSELELPVLKQLLLDGDLVRGQELFNTLHLPAIECFKLPTST